MRLNNYVESLWKINRFIYELIDLQREIKEDVFEMKTKAYIECFPETKPFQ